MNSTSRVAKSERPFPRLRQNPPPQVCARGECPAHFIAETGGAQELSVTQGALKLTSSGLRQQSHRKPISHHPVELENVILEADVLEKEAKPALVSHLFDDRMRDQAARRVHRKGNGPLERYGSLHPLCHPLAQRGSIQPRIAEPLDFDEVPVAGEICRVHRSGTPYEVDEDNAAGCASILAERRREISPKRGIALPQSSQ